MERQQRITELIEQRKNMKISDLSKELHVSDMTIHRDLQPLIEQGIVVKTFGGVMLSNRQINKQQVNECVLCNRSIHPTMSYRIIFTTNEIETACCTHCGLLRHQQVSTDIAQAICNDFLKQTTISAPLAFYVMNTTLDMGCCHPQVLPFKKHDDARKFVKGFGGNIYSFDDAIEMVFKKMNGSDSTCHSLL